MSYLTKEQAERIISQSEFETIKPIIEKNALAIRCNKGKEYSGGDGYNIDCDSYSDYIKYATALYASICFMQDTIHEEIDSYYLLLLKNCSLGHGETYTYRQGSDSYQTFPKCHGLGSDAEVTHTNSINNSAIHLSRYVVNWVLSLS